MKEIVHLFSGGTDSTYAAVQLAKIYDRIHLITYERFGLLDVKNSGKNVVKLSKLFGSKKFIHTIINFDSEFRALSYGNYFPDILKHGFYTLLTCAVCKLAMHWRTILYCFDHGIKYVSDGAAREMMWSDPSQHEKVIKEMRALYQAYGIQYFSPVYEALIEQRDRTLYELGIVNQPIVKWTAESEKMQPRCPQEMLNILLLEYCWDNYTAYMNFSELTPEHIKYETTMLGWHAEKREYVKKQIDMYFSGSSGKI